MNEEVIIETYRDYISLKLHFSQEAYNFDGANNIKKADMNSFIKRKDGKVFVRFAEKFNERKERIEMLTTLFFNNPDGWIGEIFEEDFKDAHKLRKQNVIMLEYNFKSQIEKICDFMETKELSLKDLFLTKNGKPDIIKFRKNIIGGVNDETLALIDVGYKFCKTQTDDPLWGQKKFAIAKYGMLLKNKIDENVLISGLERLAEFK